MNLPSKTDLLTLIAGVCWPVLSYSSATAQDYGLSETVQIETQSLGEAQDFDAGILQDSALDSGLWQGTSAARAAKLLVSSPLKSQDPMIKEMVRTVVLSGGVPPQAVSASGGQEYESARLQAVLALESGKSGNTATLDGFLARNPDLARAPLAQVDLALSKGEWQRACEISDTITTERAQPQWARLRAACHALRGEMSAADVTRDLLRSSGYDNPAYHAQIDALLSGQGPAAATDPTDALVTYLATRGRAASPSSAPPEDVLAGGREADLTTLFKNFADTDLSALQSALGNLSFDIEAPDMDLDTALSNSGSRATARLFVLGQSGDTKAFDAFLTRALRAGVDEVTAFDKLGPIIQALPAQARVDVNLKRYTRAALLSRDIGSLQQFYSVLPEGASQARIALIADALGGGFAAQDLGRDIEGRLDKPIHRAQAIKDTQIALALGATLSDPAAEVLSTAVLSRPTIPEGQLILLDAAALANSRAETTLRAATLMSRPGLNTTDKSKIIAALTEAGLQRFAGPIAADMFFDGLSVAK